MKKVWLAEKGRQMPKTVFYLKQYCTKSIDIIYINIQNNDYMQYYDININNSQ